LSLKQPIFSVTGCCLSCECYQQQQQQQPATSLVTTTTVGYAASLYDDWLWRCAGVDVVNDGVNYSVTESATTRARASCRRAHSAIWCRVSRRHASPGIGPTVYTGHLFWGGVNPQKLTIPPNGCQIVCSRSFSAGKKNYDYTTETFLKRTINTVIRH